MHPLVFPQEKFSYSVVQIVRAFQFHEEVFFSIAIEADAESPACPVEFLASILIRFRAENVRSTEAVDTVMVNAKQTNPAVEFVVVSDDLALDLFLQSEARAMSSMAS